MTRKEILTEYNFKYCLITNPGKFEGEPVYSPYFYDQLLNGFADEDDGELAVFKLVEEDFKEFPELISFKIVQLRQDNNGFIHCIAY